MSKENYKNYFNGGCSTCMFAERDERGRYLGSCSGFSNCSYEEYKGETDITEEEKDEKIADLEAKLAESEAEHERLIDAFEEETEKLRKQIKEESDARKRFVEAVKELKQQLAEKEKEIEKFKIKDTIGLSDFIDENSKKLAIAELEKVKEWFISNSAHDCNNNAVLIDYTIPSVANLLNIQIKELNDKK